MLRHKGLLPHDYNSTKNLSFSCHNRTVTSLPFTRVCMTLLPASLVDSTAVLLLWWLLLLWFFAPYNTPSSNKGSYSFMGWWSSSFKAPINNRRKSTPFFIIFSILFSIQQSVNQGFLTVYGLWNNQITCLFISIQDFVQNSLLATVLEKWKQP